MHLTRNRQESKKTKLSLPSRAGLGPGVGHAQGHLLLRAVLLMMDMMQDKYTHGLIIKQPSSSSGPPHHR